MAWRLHVHYTLYTVRFIVVIIKTIASVVYIPRSVIIKIIAVDTKDTYMYTYICTHTFKSTIFFNEKMKWNQNDNTISGIVNHIQTDMRHDCIDNVLQEQYLEPIT